MRSPDVIDERFDDIVRELRNLPAAPETLRERVRSVAEREQSQTPQRRRWAWLSGRNAGWSLATAVAGVLASAGSTSLGASIDLAVAHQSLPPFAWGLPAFAFAIALAFAEPALSPAFALGAPPFGLGEFFSMIALPLSISSNTKQPEPSRQMISNMARRFMPCSSADRGRGLSPPFSRSGA